MKHILYIIFLVMVFTSPLEAREFTLVFNNYPPFEYITPEGPTGLSVVKIKRIFAKLGHTVKFQHVPWSRALKMSKSHEVDGIFSLFKTKERQAFFVYPDFPLFQSRDLLISKALMGVKVRSFEDLKKYKIGVVKDNSHGALFDNLKLNKDFSVSTEIPLIRKLAAGRLDLIVCTEQVFYHYLKQLKMKPEQFEIQPLVVNSEDLYFALSKKVPGVLELAKKLSIEIKKMEK